MGFVKQSGVGFVKQSGSKRQWAIVGHCAIVLAAYPADHGRHTLGICAWRAGGDTWRAGGDEGVLDAEAGVCSSLVAHDSVRGWERCHARPCWMHAPSPLGFVNLWMHAPRSLGFVSLASRRR